MIWTFLLVADSKSCTFVIGQIISNAIKYRKDNLQIEFSTKTDKNNISLFISDNGIGISAADLPRVFDKGFTGENGRRYSKFNRDWAVFEPKADVKK